MAIRRRNSIAHRFAKIRGLPPDEKALMQRIAHLLDGALNNRQAANPFEPSRNRIDRTVYPPTGLLKEKGVQSTKLLWDAVPSDQLLRYELQITNLTTGDEFTKSSFTNQYIFKGSTGSYLAKVYSIGRNGNRSEVNSIEFSMGDDIMLIEGAKNGPTELGTMVQDSIELLLGHQIFAWGSVVLDKFIAGESNNQVVFELYRAPGADADISEAALVEQIVLYAATESGTNLDDNARAGLITRPTGVPRVATFETSQSVMFSPIPVADEDADSTHTFFLKAINREIEEDEVCLSLVLWSGSAGTGDSVPGDPFSPEPPYVFPHKNSFLVQQITPSPGAGMGSDVRQLGAVIQPGYNLIGNEWTIAMWIRIMNLNADDIDDLVLNAGGPLFSRGPASILTAGLGPSKNKIIFTIVTGGSDTFHDFRIIIADKDGNFIGSSSQTVRYLAATGGSNNDRSLIFRWGGMSNFDPDQNSGWYFLVVCFNGGLHTGGTPKIRTYINRLLHSTLNIPTMDILVPSGTDSSLTPVIQDDSGYNAYLIGETVNVVGTNSPDSTFWTRDKYAGSFRNASDATGVQIHQLGIWNTALDSTQAGVGINFGVERPCPINALFNNGLGTEVDWRENTTVWANTAFKHYDYTQAENLCHLVQFGAVEQPLSTYRPGRDTGFHLFGGDLNFTQNIEPFTPAIVTIDGDDFVNNGNSWTDDTSIADVLSPEGLNGTTQYARSYPGVGMDDIDYISSLALTAGEELSL